MEQHDARNLRGTLLDERAVFTLHELCRACGVHAELVIEMVEEGVLEPRGGTPSEWRFAGSAVTRAQKALNLARDLRVNLPGAALALDLLEEIEKLRLTERTARKQVGGMRGANRRLYYYRKKRADAPGRPAGGHPTASSAGIRMMPRGCSGLQSASVSSRPAAPGQAVLAGGEDGSDGGVLVI